MRTKTTILSAVALAAGLLSASAQVYSANVVGYYNVAVAPGGYKLIANQLTNSANDVNVVLGAGAKSDVNGIDNTVLYLWGGSGYNIYQYFTGPDADNYFLIGPGSVNGWYDATGTLAVGQLSQGTGHFLFNPSATAITNTFVGQVVQGPFARTIKTGFDTYSIIPPVSTNVDNFVGFPGTSDVNGINNDQIYIYNGGYNIYQYFTGSDADNYFLIGPGSPAGWYDAVGTLQSSKQLVGQGFFLNHLTAPVVWNSSFTVQ